MLKTTLQSWTCINTNLRSARSFRVLATLFVIALIPTVCFNLIISHAAHKVPGDNVILGLPHVDLAVYYACARETWDEHQLLFYASPYSSLADSPRIYSHFAFLVMGCVLRALNYSVYYTDHFCRLVFGTLALLLAGWVFIAALPAKQRCTPTAICGAALVMLGGGAAWLTASCNLTLDTFYVQWFGQGQPSFKEWLASWPMEWQLAEGGYGEWGASPVRILFSVPECMYHVLFFGSILAVMVKRPVLAMMLFALTWWSHPFTGFLLGAILLPYFGFSMVQKRRGALPLLLCGAAIQLLFLTYYFLFLPRYPEHHTVMEQMARFGSLMLFSKLFPAYGALLPLTLIYATRRRRIFQHDANAVLMLCWLCADALLIFSNHLTTRAVQPMHFSRGYLYVPLAYFTIRGLREWRWTSASVARQTLCAAALLIIHLPDTLTYFLSLQTLLSERGAILTLPRKTAEVLQQLDRLVPNPISVHVMPSGSLANAEVLTPVLTRHRSLVPHLYNTPDYRAKEQYAAQLNSFTTGTLVSKFGLDALVIGPTDVTKLKALGLPTTTTLQLPEGRALLYLAPRQLPTSQPLQSP